MAPDPRASVSDTSDTGSIITVGGQSTSRHFIAGTPPTSISGSSATGAATPIMTPHSAIAGRSMRPRSTKKEYNIKKLVGTARHTRRRYLGLLTTAELEAQKTQAQADALLAASVPALDSSTDDEHSQSVSLDEQLQTSAQETEEHDTTNDDSFTFDGTSDGSQQSVFTPIQTASDTAVETTLATNSGGRSLRQRATNTVYNEQELAGTHIHARRGYLNEEKLKARDEHNANNKGVKASPRKPKKPKSVVSKVASFAKGFFKSSKRKMDDAEDTDSLEDASPMPPKKKARASGSANFNSDVTKAPAPGKAVAYDKKYEVEGLFKGAPPRLAWTQEMQDATDASRQRAKKKRGTKKTLKSHIPQFDGPSEETNEAEDSEDEDSDEESNREDSDDDDEDYNRVPSERALRWNDSTILPPPTGAWGRKLGVENAQGLFIEDRSKPQTVRNFALPWIVATPLENESVPKNYQELTENALSTDAKKKFNKAKQINGLLDVSTCACHKYKRNCDETCLNRATSVECNGENCHRGEHCENREFANFDKRMKGLGHGHGPNAFTTGVQVFKTAHCGHGIKAIREFEAGELIMEYCGEMITQEEQDKRMEIKYKGKYQHFYFMSMSGSIVGVDKMVIDATKRGSVARFVNHSCDPNCDVKHVVVNLKPRVGLFAGRKIYAGEELTYDYNFSPFGEEKQKCYCGSGICRGYLGPKPNQKEEIGLRAKEAKRRAAEEEEKLARKKAEEEAEQEATLAKIKHTKRKGPAPRGKKVSGTELTGSTEATGTALNSSTQATDTEVTRAYVTRPETFGERLTIKLRPSGKTSTDATNVQPKLKLRLRGKTGTDATNVKPKHDG